MTKEDLKKKTKTSENTTKVYKEETITRSKSKSSKEQKICDNSEEKVKELLKGIKKLKEENKKLKSRKKYGIVWEGEKELETVVTECKEKIPILKDVKDKEILTDENKPMNILIEGDNYHALQVLNYTHKGKVDIIYIDPPYNTGKANEWKYNDRYVDENDTYRHSKWLNFMDKRLRLAKELLLKDTGVIFISIDDNEQAQLKLLCDDIFGEENFVTNSVRINKGGGGHDSSLLAIEYDYLLCYSKNKKKIIFNKQLVDLNDPKYRYKDKYFEKRGKYYLRDLDYRGSYSKSLDYPLKTPEGNSVYPGGKLGEPNTWRWRKEKVEWGTKNGFIVFKKRGNQWKVYIKQYQYVDNEDQKRVREIPYRALIDYKNTLGATDLRNILDQKIFQYPKPVELTEFICSLIPNKNLIIMDFFAGTGTTGHSVLRKNDLDNGNRKFILCTNNEGNICTEVCYPRIEKVIRGYETPKGEKIKGLKGNLKYFKTEFIDVGSIYNISDEKKIELTYKAGEMIAIRENAFEEVDKNKWWQIFKSKNKTVAIYFREDQSKLEELFEKLKNDNTVLYLFSWGKNELKAQEYGYVNITIKDIPQPIIEVYKEINKIK